MRHRLSLSRPRPRRGSHRLAYHAILPPETNIKRVSFNSITKDAVLKALENPREIDIALVNAQQARRLLDRIVGYKISPILNRRIQRGREGFVSAGTGAICRPEISRRPRKRNRSL